MSTFRYDVKVAKSAAKGIMRMPENERKVFNLLALDLAERGPVLKEWPNFSSLGKDQYHCHLSRKWVACWRSEKKSIVIEVYYAGSREDAPY